MLMQVGLPGTMRIVLQIFLSKMNMDYRSINGLPIATAELTISKS